MAKKGDILIDKVGDIGLNLILNGNSFNRQLNNIQTQVESAANKITASFKKMGVAVAAAFSAKAVASFGKECIDLSSELHAMQSIVKTAFPAMQNKVNSFAKSAVDNFGLSEAMADKYVGTLGSMASAFGFTEKEAYNMSTTLAGLAGDVASYYHLSQDEAFKKLQSVFTGEAESLKQLGVVMTQNALDAYALANGFGKTTSKMTEQEKVALRYKFVMNQLSLAQGDFTRTSNAWGNQIKVLKLNFDSLKASLGQSFIMALKPVVQMLNGVLAKLSETSEKAYEFLNGIWESNSTKNTSNTVSSLSEASNEADNLSISTEKTANNLTKISKSAKKLKENLAGFDKLNVLSKDDSTDDTASTKVNSQMPKTAVASIPIEVKTKSLSSAQRKIKRFCDTIKNLLKTVGKSFRDIWNDGSGAKTLGNLKKLGLNFLDIVSDIGEAFVKAWNKGELGNQVVKSIYGRFNSLLELINHIARDFRKVWNNGTGEKIWSNILQTIRNSNNAVKTLRDRIKLAWDKNKIGQKIWKNILGIVEDITAYFRDMSKIRLDWLKHLDFTPMANTVEKLTGAFKGLLKVCGDKLKSVYKKILLPFAKWTIEKAVPKSVEMLSNALNGIANIANKISAHSLSGIAGGIAAVATAVIAFKAGITIAAGIDKIKNSLRALMITMSAHPIAVIFSGIAAAIAGLVAAVKTVNKQRWDDLGFTKQAENMQETLDKITECKSEIEELCDDIKKSLSETASDMGVIDNYQKRLEELLSKANLTPEEQAELVTIGDYFSDKYPEFKSAWEKYIQKNDDGTLKINGKISKVKTELSELIEQYKKLAATAALSDLSQKNTESGIKSQKKLNEAASNYLNAKETLNKFKKKWNLTDENLKKIGGGSNFEVWESKRDKYGHFAQATTKDLATQYDDLKSKLSSAKSEFDSASKSTSQFKQNTEDLSRMQAVVNGNYKDAAAVLMAYQNSLISAEDVQNSQWKSLKNLKKAAKDSGKNLVFGLSTGVNDYLDEVKDVALNTAKMYLDTLREETEIHSPSEKTYEIGYYLIQGLVNGVKDNIKLITNSLKHMVMKIQEKLEPIKSVFKSVFGGVWTVIKNPLNSLMSHLENFINAFIGGVNKMLEGVDWAVGSVGDIFGQEWHVGKLSKISLPRFAKGGLVKAPTLALVGDNKNARNDPEVISPLSKLKGMIDSESSGGDAQVVVMLSKILRILEKIYSCVSDVSINDNGKDIVIAIDGEEVFRVVRKKNDRYKKMHGKSAFV